MDFLQSILMPSHLNVAYVTKRNGCFTLGRLSTEGAATIDKDDDDAGRE